MRPLQAASNALRSSAACWNPPRTALSWARQSTPPSCPWTPAFLATSTCSNSRQVQVVRAFSYTPQCQKKKSKAVSEVRGPEDDDFHTVENLNDRESGKGGRSDNQNNKKKGKGGNNGADNIPEKKKVKGGNNTAADTKNPPAHTDAAAGDSLAADPENPFNFDDLTSAFDRAEKRFAEELKKLRSGGRFNADVIGAIPVQPDKKSTQTFPLRELATVAPLGGRRWSILAFEESSVKAILSAVQRSEEFNQQPQRSEDNPLELTMAVEPERADALARRAKDVCQAWRTRVRDEAHRRGEVHKRWRAEKVVLSDDAHKLKDRLQKLQDDRMKAILAKEKEVVNAIMARG